ncbi:hypothetical protein PRIPAC_88710, partial [Pristionchus pacificus]|uniref:Uncharacterized protein n=1 Tax=Pristionchus pacificus TaxID=54126 RepID=A0A2A6CXM0_PRIPA
EYSYAWEQDIVGQDSLLDARKVIEIMDQNAHLLSKECAQDIGLIMSALFEMGATSGNLTDFDRQVLLPMLDSSFRIGPAILRGHTYFAGHFSECKEIDYAVEESGSPSFTNPVCAVQRTNDNVPDLDAGFYIAVCVIFIKLLKL